MKAGEFKIRRILARERGFTYPTYQVVGYLEGQRVRKRFKSLEEAAGEKSRLEIAAANADGGVRSVHTRLSTDQVAEAEACVRRLGGRSLTLAVDWFLENYRPPCAEKPLSEAVTDFVTSRAEQGEAVHRDDVECKLKAFGRKFPNQRVHEIGTADVLQYLTRSGWAPKTQNNIRGILHTFFSFCADDARRWATSNPVKAVPKLDVPRGLPEIMSADRITELFTFLETYTGSPRKPQKPGFLVPYFALATFAGMRPAVPTGEIWKLGHVRDLKRLVDLDVGVIRVTPDVAKTDSIRQIKVRPNLAAWLKRYPLGEFPIVMPGMQGLVSEVRKKFAIGDDVLRHTFISMHVAKWRSLGEAALEAGNSEGIIKKHYLNLVGESEADRFWEIRPTHVVMLA